MVWAELVRAVVLAELTLIKNEQTSQLERAGRSGSSSHRPRDRTPVRSPETRLPCGLTRAGIEGQQLACSPP